MKTRTLVVDLERIRDRGDDGVTVVGLMMAANDIAEANLGYGRHDRDPRSTAGQRRYFVRLQCGHLVEAIEYLIPRIRASSKLMILVQKCSNHARESFELMDSCLRGGQNRARFEKNVIRLRSTLAFHYELKQIERALVDRAARNATRRSTVTMSNTLQHYRFHVADDVEDSIVGRQIWKIPHSTTGDMAKAAANQVQTFIGDLCRKYVDFAHEVCVAFLRDTGATT